MIRSARIARLIAILLGIVAIFASMQAAQATLTSLQVTLRDPDNFSPELFDPPGPNSGTDGFVDTVSVGAGREISTGDATHIGGATVGGSTLLLANEYVDADPNPISGTACSVLGAICVYQVVLGLEAGADDHTGYGASAFYAFSDFAFSTNSQVVGVTLNSTGISGLGTLNTTQGQVSVVNGVITVLIGNLTMPNPSCPGEVACGQVLLNLSVQAVPEPQTYALMGAGLGLLIVVGRRRRNS